MPRGKKRSLSPTEGGEFREGFLEEAVSGLNFERQVRVSQTKETGKGTAVRKQRERRLGGVSQHRSTVCSGGGGLEAGLCHQSIKCRADYGERMRRGSWASTAVLRSFDFIPRATGNH